MRAPSHQPRVSLDFRRFPEISAPKNWSNKNRWNGHFSRRDLKNSFSLWNAEARFEDYDQLHHFLAEGVWDAAPLESELLVQADRLVGGCSPFTSTLTATLATTR